MPIIVHGPIRRLSQSEFRDLSYTVMRHVFDMHRDLGRLFDEKIYKRELARRAPAIRLEVPVTVSLGSFTKKYFLDVLVGLGLRHANHSIEAVGQQVTRWVH
ncbi:MAG: GxxExxY protein [Verrucomicrobia bacterium]|nr:GxxExxY protein [Verrucomicrobiota bacterium]